jgi:hypothetical protein
VFWRGVLSGLAFEPHFAERYEFRIDDVSELLATGEFLRERGRDQDSAAVGGTTRNYAGIRWAGYGRLASELLIDSCASSNPGIALQRFLL